MSNLYPSFSFMCVFSSRVEWERIFLLSMNTTYSTKHNNRQNFKIPYVPLAFFVYLHWLHISLFAMMDIYFWTCFPNPHQRNNFPRFKTPDKYFSPFCFALRHDKVSFSQLYALFNLAFNLLLPVTQAPWFSYNKQYHSHLYSPFPLTPK